MMRYMPCLLAMVAMPAAAQSDETARAIVERGIAAHGGEAWLAPGTLALAGTAVFYAPDSADPRATADDYRMWRAMDPDRASAHGASGKVRITAKDGERVIFEVGYDGETTWTERGVMPKADADAYWASNFGFGVLRSALDEGFRLERAPSRDVGEHAVDLVRVIDTAGQTTLFGFDTGSGFIRYMAFDAPRGFHERVYDDFIRLSPADGGWVQAREVTLFYNGVKANTVRWETVEVAKPIDPALFAPPAQRVENAR